MMNFKREELPYLQGTIALIIDDERNFLIVNKTSYENDQWACSGGGVEEGETPEQAILRELKEELGTDKFEILAKSKKKNQFEWPDDLIERNLKKGTRKFRGQQQTVFLVKFLGEKDNIVPNPNEKMRRIKWVTKEELPEYLIFPNQREQTKRAIDEFFNS